MGEKGENLFQLCFVWRRVNVSWVLCLLFLWPSKGVSCCRQIYPREFMSCGNGLAVFITQHLAFQRSSQKGTKYIFLDASSTGNTRSCTRRSTRTFLLQESTNVGQSCWTRQWDNFTKICGICKCNIAFDGNVPLCDCKLILPAQMTVIAWCHIVQKGKMSE